jgi:hypothetical protein
MARIRTDEDWLSLIDERNELALRAAFVAVVAAWGAALLMTFV